MGFSTVNPRTEQVIKSYAYENWSKIEQRLSLAERAFKGWRKTEMKRRTELFLNLADIIERDVEKLGETASLEMGKHYKEGVSEAAKCAYLVRKTLDHIEDWIRPEEVVVDGLEHHISFEPLGCTLSIMPWNFPFWQAFRAAVSALLAGNVTILKHAESVTGCALEIERMFIEAGFPEGVFQTIICDHESAARMMEHPIICGVSFTGSCRGGAEVAMSAGRNLKKSVLELGGSDPFIVLEDADLDKAIPGAVLGRFMNAGQVCISSKRFIVHKDIYQKFLTKFNEAVVELEIAPLVNKRAVDEIHEQVQDAASKGANVIVGGHIEKKTGFFYQPTILTNITKDMRVYSEEVFGPVALVFVVDNDEEAIALANDTEFGLGASIWSENRARAKKIARDIEAGAIFINSIVKSDPMMPFGGVKRSGFGRELQRFGIFEFVNVKGLNVY